MGLILGVYIVQAITGSKFPYPKCINSWCAFRRPTRDDYCIQFPRVLGKQIKLFENRRGRDIFHNDK